MIWLDHAATGLPRDPEALAAAAEAAGWATPGRGLHGEQSRSLAAVEAARAEVAALASGGAVCFCAGATAALNQAIAGLRPRPRRVGLGPLVHNAVLRPALALNRPLWVLPHDAAGRIDVVAARASWPDDLDLVVVSHGSNVNGVLQPVAALAEVARPRGTTLLVDAAQTAGVLRRLELGDADLVAFSGHKGLRTPPGIGALVVRGDVRLEPLVRGGVGFDADDPDMPDELPARLEAGTPNLPGIAALAAAARARPGDADPRELAGRLRHVVERAGLVPIGADELPIVSVRVPGLPPTEVEHLLDRVYGIIVRAGLHCAPQAHQTLGTTPLGTVRISAGPATTEADLEALGRALLDIRRSAVTVGGGHG